MKHKNFQNIGSELAGSFGDLGTVLPYVIGAITIASLDVTSVFVMFGLMYLFTAWFYRLPIPVQPMKIIGAAIIVHHLTAGEIAACGILMGILLLTIALTGVVDKLSAVTPFPVIIGIQAGLGISLAMLGINMITSDLLLGIIILVLMLFFLNSTRLPAAIVALFGGTALAFVLHPELSFPTLHWGISLPKLVIPVWQDYYRGFLQGALPQLPLTLTNSVLITTALATELFPKNSERVTPKNLCLTLGIGNLVGAPLGLIPICHGSGGLAAHYRFGARTGISIGFMGLLFIIIGVFLGSSGLLLVQIIPQAVLGCMLFFSGVDLIKPIKHADTNEMFVFAVVIILSVAVNPGIGFIIGVPLWFLLKKGWLAV